MRISNVRIEGGEADAEELALCWQTPRSRYHVWVNVGTRTPGAVIYQQMLDGQLRVRQLDATLGVNRLMLDAALAAAEDARLFEKYAEKLDAQRGERAARQAEQDRIEQMRARAPELHDALQALVKTAHIREYLHASDPKALQQALRALRGN